MFGRNGNDKTNISADILLVFVTMCRVFANLQWKCLNWSVAKYSPAPRNGVKQMITFIFYLCYCLYLYMYGISVHKLLGLITEVGMRFEFEHPGVIYKRIPSNIFEYKPPPLYLNSEHTSTMDGHIRPRGLHSRKYGTLQQHLGPLD